MVRHKRTNTLSAKTLGSDSVVALAPEMPTTSAQKPKRNFWGRRTNSSNKKSSVKRQEETPLPTPGPNNMKENIIKPPKQVVLENEDWEAQFESHRPFDPSFLCASLISYPFEGIDCSMCTDGVSPMLDACACFDRGVSTNMAPNQHSSSTLSTARPDPAPQSTQKQLVTVTSDASKEGLPSSNIPQQKQPASVQNEAKISSTNASKPARRSRSKQSSSLGNMVPAHKLKKSRSHQDNEQRPNVAALESRQDVQRKLKSHSHQDNDHLSNKNVVLESREDAQSLQEETPARIDSERDCPERIAKKPRNVTVVKQKAGVRTGILEPKSVRDDLVQNEKVRARSIDASANADGDKDSPEETDGKVRKVTIVKQKRGVRTSILEPKSFHDVGVVKRVEKEKAKTTSSGESKTVQDDRDRSEGVEVMPRDIPNPNVVTVVSQKKRRHSRKSISMPKAAHDGIVVKSKEKKERPRFAKSLSRAFRGSKSRKSTTADGQATFDSAIGASPTEYHPNNQKTTEPNSAISVKEEEDVASVLSSPSSLQNKDSSQPSPDTIKEVLSIVSVKVVPEREGVNNADKPVDQEEGSILKPATDAVSEDEVPVQETGSTQDNKAADPNKESITRQSSCEDETSEEVTNTHNEATGQNEEIVSKQGNQKKTKPERSRSPVPIMTNFIGYDDKLRVDATRSAESSEHAGDVEMGSCEGQIGKSMSRPLERNPESFCEKDVVSISSMPDNGSGISKEHAVVVAGSIDHSSSTETAPRETPGVVPTPEDNNDASMSYEYSDSHSSSSEKVADDLLETGSSQVRSESEQPISATTPATRTQEAGQISTALDTVLLHTSSSCEKTSEIKEDVTMSHVVSSDDGNFFGNFTKYMETEDKEPSDASKSISKSGSFGSTLIKVFSFGGISIHISRKSNHPKDEKESDAQSLPNRPCRSSVSNECSFEQEVSKVGIQKGAFSLDSSVSSKHCPDENRNDPASEVNVEVPPTPSSADMCDQESVPYTESLVTVDLVSVSSIEQDENVVDTAHSSISITSTCLSEEDVDSPSTLQVIDGPYPAIISHQDDNEIEVSIRSPTLKPPLHPNTFVRGI